MRLTLFVSTCFFSSFTIYLLFSNLRLYKQRISLFCSSGSTDCIFSFVFFSLLLLLMLFSIFFSRTLHSHTYTHDDLLVFVINVWLQIITKKTVCCLLILFQQRKKKAKFSFFFFLFFKCV